jgi:uncharacterized spore protein YtfJ
MDVEETISAARDSMTVKRVYGEAYERNGVAIIPAANVQGGAGGGSGEDPDGRTGGGGGFGIRATPAGAYVIRGDQIRWQPALNLNLVILGCQLLGLAALLLMHHRSRSGR